MKKIEIEKYFIEMYDNGTETSKEIVKEFTDFVIENDIPKDKWDEIDCCSECDCDQLDTEFIEIAGQMIAQSCYEQKY